MDIRFVCSSSVLLTVLCVLAMAISPQQQLYISATSHNRNVRQTFDASNQLEHKDFSDYDVDATERNNHILNNNHFDASEDISQSEIGDDNNMRTSSMILGGERNGTDNRKPSFRDCKNYAPSVKEEQPPNVFVMKVEAVDPDESDHIEYSFVISASERPRFRIDSKTGEIYTSHTFDRDEPSREKEVSSFNEICISLSNFVIAFPLTGKH